MLNQSVRDMNEGQNRSNRRWRWGWISALALPLLMFLLLPRRGDDGGRTTGSSAATESSSTPAKSSNRSGHSPRSGAGGLVAADPEAIVAEKLSHFARDRFALLKAWAKQQKLPVPPEVERFFDAAAAGRWEEVERLFESLKQLRQTPG